MSDFERMLATGDPPSHRAHVQALIRGMAVDEDGRIALRWLLAIVSAATVERSALMLQLGRAQQKVRVMRDGMAKILEDTEP